MKIKITNYAPSLKEERECNECKLDTNEVVASTVFAQLMGIATLIFIDRLMLGGNYELNTDDKLTILDSLHNIVEILEKYK